MFGVLRKKCFRANKYSIFRMLTFLLLGSAGLFVFFPHEEPINELVLSRWSESNCHVTASWKMKPIDNWTLEEMLDYMKWPNRSACTLAHDFGGVAVFSVGVDGQKTVCLDESVRPERSAGGWPVPTNINQSAECLVYSFGINNEWSFDEAMEWFGCRVFSFDPSMNIGHHNHTKKVHFYNLGLNDVDGTLYNKKLDNITSNWTMLTLDSIYRKLLKNEGRIIDYLKIDIEQSEWAVLPQIISSGMMDNVRQIGVEMHLFPEKEFCRLEDIRKRVKIIQSMEDYGLVRFDAKYNPWSHGLKVIDRYREWEGHTAYEIAWYNSKIVRESSSIDLNGLY